MAIVTLPNQEFLRKEYIADKVADLINPNLIWEPLFPHVAANAKSVAWVKDNYSDMTDPLKRLPALRTSVSEFAHIGISGVDRYSSALKGVGFELDFDEDVALYETEIDTINRGTTRAAWWLSEYLNNQLMYDLTNNWSTSLTSDTTLASILTHESSVGYENTNGHIVISQNPTYAWNATAADPIADILEWKTAFSAQEPATGQRYGYKLTNVYVDEIEFGDLIKYLVEVDAEWQVNPVGGEISIPEIAGVTIVPVQAAMYTPTGTKQSNWAILLDKNHPSATIYESYDPRYIKSGYFNYNQYTTDNDHKVHNQWWNNRVAVMREPKAFGYVTGI